MGFSVLQQEDVQFTKTCGWSAEIAQQDYQKYIEQEDLKPKLQPRWQVHIQKENRPKTTFGESYLKSLMSMLKRFDSLGWKRSADQVRFHRAFVSACLQKILGQNASRDLIRLMKIFDLEELRFFYPHLNFYPLPPQERCLDLYPQALGQNN